MRRQLLCTLPLCLSAVATPLAAQRLYKIEIGGAGGYHLFDSSLQLGSSIGGAVRVGYWITGSVSVEAEGNFANPKTDSPLKKSVGTKTFGLWALGNFRAGRTTTAFLKGGVGRVGYGSCSSVSVPGSGPCGGANVLQGGAGVRIPLSPTLFMRYEGVVNRSLSSRKFSNATLQGGLSLMLGSQPLVDKDGDGVFDRYDQCEDTRIGALVDKRGCPNDLDRDGVPDGLDRCPNTQEGATVDGAGCTTDTDDDGVLEGLDQCPETPKGALIDSRGCPTDSDTDGVFDGLDRCQLTPPGAIVDELGCPGDADNDGVFDGLDQCAGTELGVPTDAKGCPVAPPPTPLDSVSGEQTWVLPGEVWEFRSAVLSPEGFIALDSVVATLKAVPDARVAIHAFSQDRLVPADNTRLSRRRADVVRDYFASQGIAVSRITAVGRGSQTLIVPDTTEAARITNRRVEIRVTRKQ